jgi:hypothetical protein
LSQLTFRIVSPLPFYLRSIKEVSAEDLRDQESSFDKQYYLRQIAQGKASDVINGLLANPYIQSRPKHYESLVLLSAKKEKIQLDWTKGTLFYEEYNREMARIADALLTILTELDNKYPTSLQNSGILLSDFVIDFQFKPGAVGWEVGFDIKLLNNSDEIVILNRFNLKVLEAPQTHENKWLESSHTYEVAELKLENAGDELNLPISQIMEPKSADRFEIRILNCSLIEPPILCGTSFHTSQGLLQGPELGIFVPE